MKNQTESTEGSGLICQKQCTAQFNPKNALIVSIILVKILIR